MTRHFIPPLPSQTYPERYKDIVIPDAYERLILDCIRWDVSMNYLKSLYVT